MDIVFSLYHNIYLFPFHQNNIQLVLYKNCNWFFERLIFSYDYISLFDVTKTTLGTDPLERHYISPCPSGEEKGGIYYDEKYYTTCLDQSDNTKFRINIYDSNFALQSSTDPYSFTSPIRFFIKDTSPIRVEASWTNNGMFNTIKFQNGNDEIYSQELFDDIYPNLDSSEKILNSEFDNNEIKITTRIY